MAEPVVEALARAPAPPLRPFIERYVGYRFEGFPPGIHRGLPSRHLTFIVSLRDPIDTATSSYSAVVGGLHDGPALIRHDGTQFGLCVEATPLGARNLFGVPAGALASTAVEPHELLGPGARNLSDRLASAATWNDRFDVLDALLSASLRDGAPAAEIVEAWRLLVRAAGALSIQGVADEIGWSRRHLAQRFRIEVGLPPKTVARLLRFERARRVLERAERPPLAEVAALAGYFDQAHLSRGFNDFAGCSPTTWLREELPSVQDNLTDSAPD